MQDTERTDTAGQPHEGRMTRAIEKQTAKIPSLAFLVAAGGAIALSLGLALSKRNKDWANFVAEWVPTLLLIGIYNKLVKIESEDLEAFGWQH